MSSTYHTKGIVLRNVSYSETSIICTIYTERFGTQSYIVSGVRTEKKTSKKGMFFQPAALLDMVVYHNELKNLNRVKEFGWHHLYHKVFFSVTHYAVASFIVDLMSRTLRQPDQNVELYQFTEKTLLFLDGVEKKNSCTYLLLYYTIEFLRILGFRIDLDQIRWTSLEQKDQLYQHMEELLRIQDMAQIGKLDIGRQDRNSIISLLLDYYKLHIHDFGDSRTYQVIKRIFS